MLAKTPLMINGASHPAQSFRLMIRDLAQGAEGVTSGGDLKVRALTVPGSKVQVGDGSGIAKGRMDPWQGHYSFYNIGTFNVDIAPTGSSPRSDMVCVRILDPEYEGGRDPMNDATVEFAVAPNVGDSATMPPAGWTGIPLARVDMPPGTSVITADMVKDLRFMANPRRDRRVFPKIGAPYDPIAYTDDTWQDWPSAAIWQLTIPPWAVKAIVRTNLSGLRVSGGSVFADLRHLLASTAGADSQIDDDGGTGFRRMNHEIGDELVIPEELRGTTQTLKIQTRVHNDPGTLDTNSATRLFLDVEWQEGLL
ncbi:hypothetical protein ACIF6L_34695 [Kitasatospora sp. NPDC086009]|uniref:hypothetical protein n=1 Tax=unclassified Kitasatospora TaxID=2633591 RepID=UPI0037C8D3E5